MTHLNIALLEPIQRPKKENPIKILDLDFSNLVVPFEQMIFYTQADIQKKLIGLVGESIRTFWPTDSFELTDEQLKLLKPDLSSHEAQKKRGKDIKELIKKIDSRLEEFGIVKKSI